MLKKTLIFAAAAIAVGCSSDNNEISPLIINIGDKYNEAVALSDFFEIKSVITLQKGDTIPYPGNVRKIYPTDQSLYVSDDRSLFRYDIQGKYVNSICKYGRGPSEYMGIVDFWTDDKVVYILDQNSKIVKYSVNGNFQSSVNLGFYASTLTLYDHENLLIASAYQGEGDKYSFVSAGNFKFTHSHSPIRASECTWRHFRPQMNYFKYRGKLLFHEPFNNRIYFIERDSAAVARVVNFGSRDVPVSFLERKFKNILGMNMAFNKAGFASGAPVYAESEDNVLVSRREGQRYLMSVVPKNGDEALSFSKLTVPRIGEVGISEVLYGLWDDVNQAILYTEEIISADNSDENNIVILGKLK